MTQTMDIATAPNKDSLNWKQGETTWEEIQGWVKNPADHRECGNYVLGRLEGTRRKKDTIRSRSGIALDADTPVEGFLGDLVSSFKYDTVVHTTWRSTKESPRYRVLIRPDRDLTPDEYVSVTSALMSRLGEESFDSQSVQPERFMFMPSTQDWEEYEYAVIDGDPLPVDQFIDEFVTESPELEFPSIGLNKRDPLTLQGEIGIFNRVYSELGWDQLFEDYDIPYKRVGRNRWHYTPSDSTAGAGELHDAQGNRRNLFYSHHTTDPIHGQACSAFDLVRIHRFSDKDGDKDKRTPIHLKPSANAAKDLIKEKTPEVAAEIQREKEKNHATPQGEMSDEEWLQTRLTQMGIDTPIDEVYREDMGNVQPAWMKLIDRREEFQDQDSYSPVRPSIQNIDTVLAGDLDMRGIRYNQMTMTVEFLQLPSWKRNIRQDPPVLEETDLMAFSNQMKRVYQFTNFSLSDLRSAVLERAKRRSYHPIYDYLVGLRWDGTPRLEESLPGVRPTTSSRLIARKCLTAAVKRVFEPGCKWDHMMVIYGKEGLGKTYWLDWISHGWSAPLGRLKDKDTLMTMQRSWIVVSDEGHMMKNSEANEQKEFLTRTVDTFRAPYASEVISHPRQCVIFGTTNEEDFLRKQEGNRRFMIVHSEEQVDFDSLTDEYRDQIWAEAVHLYRSGESTFLNGQEEDLISDVREDYMEEDALYGWIEEYLNTPVPEQYFTWSPRRRYEYRQFPDELEGRRDTYISMACSSQVFQEMLGRPPQNNQDKELRREIWRVLQEIPGWRKESINRRVPGYGSQKVVVREEAMDLLE